MDWFKIADDFRNLGINNYQHSGNVIPLDKVFGLDETKHSNGLKPYGVDDIFITNSGACVKYYLGDICSPAYICSANVYNNCGGRKRYMSEEEEKGAMDYCLSLISKRKEEIEAGKYWLEHFNEFTQNCFNLAKEFVAEKEPSYKVEFLVGNSQADKRVAPAIVITEDGWQIGYIKLLQNKFGDIEFDVCRMCHTSFKVKDPSNVKSYIESACNFVL